MEKYEITVQGSISREWDEWMECAVSNTLSDGSTLVSGYIRDRAALYGVFTRMRDLGLKIIKVERSEEGRNNI